MHQPIETIARGLIRSGSRVLLCRSVKHDYHYLPGGHIEFGEPARVALARELMEESGLEARVGPLLLTEEQVFTQKGKNRHEITLIFRVDQLGPAAAMPDAVPSLEKHIEFVWADLGAIADLTIYPESTRAWLASGGAVDPSDGCFVGADPSPRRTAGSGD
jgi:ADP-ribose pyrophosphatase YjhB (NUDIX family)